MDNQAAKENMDPGSEVADHSKGEVLCFGFDTSGGKNANLQENFKKFRQAKVRERKLLKACRENSQGERSQEFKDQLRQKFIDQLKKYYGVPYHEKYRGDKPLAPLYLDCCGLIRQVLRDLQEDFGFVTGKWNQAYQFDVCPKEVPFEELRPGDLIFYEGTYTSERSKSQKHDMVHVEIFYPGETGRGTIGARHARGVVQEFPDYHFPSKLWNLKKVYFRSLDTWLEGKHESCCKEHSWASDTLAIAAAAGNRSIFNEMSDDEDCSAGGLDDFSDGEEDNKTAITPGMEDGLTQSSGPTLEGQMVPDAEQETASSAKTVVRSTKKEKKTSKMPFTYYVSKANGWTLVKAALDKRGWQQLPFEYKFSNRFGLKWVERRSQIDYKALSNGQLCCHIPNNDVITTKLGLLRTLRAGLSSGGNRVSTPWMPETYELDCPLDCAALLAADDGLTASQDGKLALWVYKPASCNRGRGVFVLKGGEALRKLCNRETEVNPNAPSTSLASPIGRGKSGEVVSTERDGTRNFSATCTPAEEAEGTSVHSFGQVHHKEDVLPIWESVRWDRTRGVVQKYIEDPLLVCGRKFDLRCYCLIARNEPHYLAYYHPGYCRRSLKAYSTSDESLADSSVHLTNVSVQKKVSNFASERESLIMLPKDLADQAESEGFAVAAAFMRDGRMDLAIKECMVGVLKAAKDKLRRGSGYFDLLGWDFMVTADGKLSLIEINT
jgi:hypothetical protein